MLNRTGFILVLAMLVSVYVCRQPALANFIGDNVRKSPEKFYVVLNRHGGVEREYLYCYSDIMYFGSNNTGNCKYTMKKFNEILERDQFGRIGEDDYRFLLKLLEVIKRNLEKKSQK